MGENTSAEKRKKLKGCINPSPPFAIPSVL